MEGLDGRVVRGAADCLADDGQLSPYSCGTTLIIDRWHGGQLIEEDCSAGSTK